MKIVIPKQAGPSNPYLDRVNIVLGDVITQDVDAVISVIPQNLEYRGSLNAALLAGAGEQLDKFILEHMYKPRAGDVYAVPGFNLPCKFLIFAVAPVWKDDFTRQERDLLSAVRKAIEMSVLMGLETLAFPPIASGNRGFPKPRAARLMIQGICERLGRDVGEIRIVCPDQAAYDIYKERLEIVKGE